MSNAELRKFIMDLFGVSSRQELKAEIRRALGDFHPDKLEHYGSSKLQGTAVNISKLKRPRFFTRVFN